MTYLELKEEIAAFCKINNLADPQYTTLLNNAIHSSYYALLDKGLVNGATKVRVIIPLANAELGQPIPAPNDLYEIQEGRYKTPLTEWQIKNEPVERVTPAAIYGKPKSYRVTNLDQTPASGIVPSVAIQLEPFVNIDPIQDQLLLDYIAVPDLVGDVFLNNALIASLRDHAIAYVLVYQGKIEQAGSLVKVSTVPVEPNAAQPK